MIFNSLNVTGFVKRGLIHASDFATLKWCNSICGREINFKFGHSVVLWCKIQSQKFEAIA